jgi:hypothetical protein
MRRIPVSVVAVLASVTLVTNLSLLRDSHERPVTIAIADAVLHAPEPGSSGAAGSSNDAQRLRDRNGVRQAQQRAADLRARREAATAPGAAEVDHSRVGDSREGGSREGGSGPRPAASSESVAAPSPAAPDSATEPGAATPAPSADPAPRTAPSPTATPTPSPSPAPSPSPSPSRAPAPSPSPSPAPSPSPTGSPAPSPTPAPACDQICRGERLYADLRIEAPSNWTVRIEGEHPSYLGLADSRTRTITIYMRASMPDRVMTWTMYHEVGHSHDFTFLNSSKRHRWSESRGYAGTAWFGCNYCSDYETPVGDWAESFAYCHTGWSDQWRSKMGATPSSQQCTLLQELRRP